MHDASLSLSIHSTRARLMLNLVKPIFEKGVHTISHHALVSAVCPLCVKNQRLRVTRGQFVILKDELVYKVVQQYASKTDMQDIQARWAPLSDACDAYTHP
ncbi:hypothetical protein POM88_048149 [Heracleum sosnowskyi]|uniref:Uncharacterized protein n=1 Tax=Heracleum sosnowskyi TaxID=360622 RepID=A0AAD8GUS4_9APIA|nr:hypothetical protein POM88_048149 [Heracleum sosnowskyi]